MTESLTQQIDVILQKAIAAEFGDADAGPLRLQAPPKPEMGDFALGCFPLAKTLRMGPPQIAAKLVPHLEGEPLFEQVTAAGPYLNLKISPGKLARLTLDSVLDDPEGFGKGSLGAGQSVLIEYSAPNTNKPLHLGHIRNNLLGLSLVNLHREAGFKVIPVNLINDRGIHICKSMLAFQRFGEGRTPESEGRKGDHFVGDFYVRYSQEEAKEYAAWKEGKTGDPEELKAQFLKESKLNAEAQEMLRKWEAEDPEVRALWEKMNAWVYAGFDVTYERLGCNFEKVYRESETYQLGKSLVEAGLEKGVFYRKEDGSTWVDLTDLKLDHKVLLRGDGTTVYITQDLGTTQLKFDDFRMDRAVWIVADEQIYHFRVLFAALKKLGFAWADGCHHLAYGMVDLPEGKMKSREGTVVDADDLMDELFAMEKVEIQSRHEHLEAEALDQTAEILSQGALKFFILKFQPKTKMTFNPEESISPEGFTGPYVQYAYVRIQGIFRKAGLAPDSTFSKTELEVLTQPDEAAVIRRLHDYPEEVRSSAEQNNPARLCSYLFELARDYNRFYHALPVLAAEKEKVKDARLALSAATARVIKKGLALLGIDVPEQM